ncbi:MAG: site-specific integrase [Chloroflexi bacterium]|nr:site-specific integrase [Chloroflexota bacterium]
MPDVEQAALTAEQAQRLLAAAQGERLAALFALALYTGMRQGELLALTWADVDWEQATVSVRRSVRHMPRVGAVAGEPKSRRSRRTLPLIPTALEALRQHRQRQLQERLTAGGWEDHDLVFPSERGTYTEATNLIHRPYRRVLARAGLPRVPFHALRHTTASLLAEAHVPLAVAQELLGHSSLAMTRHYTHIPDTMEREAATQLGQLLEFGRQDGCQLASSRDGPELETSL